jgi:hypothetical protein
LQTRRIRRWAQTHSSEDEIMNGSTPMSVRRATVGRIVGVQRRDEQMTGERGLDRDVGRLLVANFADEDDVGILTEKGRAAQRQT